MTGYRRWYGASMIVLGLWALAAMGTGGGNSGQCNANNPQNCPSPTAVCDNGQVVGNPHCATPTPTATATATPKATGTATASPSPTATATYTPRPTATVIATPTATSTPPGGGGGTLPEDAPPGGGGGCLFGPPFCGGTPAATPSLPRPTIVAGTPTPAPRNDPPPFILTPTPRALPSQLPVAGD